MDENTENNYEFELNIEELRDELGITALENELAELRKLLAEWLSYVNLVDISVQELIGEPDITETLNYNIPKGGRLKVQRQRPPIPANLARERPQMVAVPKED